MLMKRFFPHTVPLLWALTLALGGCSVVFDDLSDCPQGVTVRLWHDMPDERFEIPSSDRAVLLVFNADGTYRESYSVQEGFNGTAAHTFQLTNLPKGNYSFVGFRALRDCFTADELGFMPGVTKRDEAVFRLQYTGGQVTQEPHHVFSSGYTEAQIITHDEHFDVYMPQLTNIIVLRTVNMEPVADQFTISINDDNSNYYLDNSFASCGKFNYISNCTKDAQGQLCGRLTIMRLASGRQPRLTVENTSDGSEFFSADLVALIEKIVKDVDFEKDHYFEIVLRFDIDHEVSITINGWNFLVDDDEF